MVPILGGALALVILELVISSPATAGRLGNLATVLSHAVARFVDPTVPMLGTTTGTPSTPKGSSPAGPAKPAGPSSPAGVSGPTPAAYPNPAGDLYP